MSTFVDNHPSGSILATRARVLIAPLPPNSRVPIVRTLSLGAATLGATSVAITSTTAATLTAGTVLNGAAGARIVLAADVTLVAATASTVAVEPLTAAVLASAPFTTIGAQALKGIQQIGRPGSTNLISIRSMDSGLGNEQRPTMIDFNQPISGWVHQTDTTFAILRQAFNLGQEVFAITETPDNERRTGPAIISNLDRPVNIDDVIKFSFDLIYQGIPAVEAIT